MMEKLAKAEGKDLQFKLAQEGWTKLENTFRNTDPIAKGGSPIAQALRARDPLSKQLRPDYVRKALSDPKANRVAGELLGRYNSAESLRDPLKMLAEHNAVAKGAPKALRLKAEPKLELPEKPAMPEPKLPPPPELPTLKIEPFSTTKYRTELMEKAAIRIQHMSQWEIAAIGAGIAEMLHGQLPYAWSLPLTRRALSILENSEAYKRSVIQERPMRPTSVVGRPRAISPLTPPSTQQQPTP
jgi:hypothetical protein